MCVHRDLKACGAILDIPVDIEISVKLAQVGTALTGESWLPCVVICQTWIDTVPVCQISFKLLCTQTDVIDPSRVIQGH